MDEPTVVRGAGLAAVAAGPVLGLSAVALALFFAGRGERWGPLNDVLIALALMLMAPAVAAIAILADDTTGAWFVLLSVLALVGITVAAGGQLLLVAGGISLRTSFVTGGLGVLALLPWALGLVVLAFTTDALSTAVGALLAASMLVAALTTAAAMVARGWLAWMLGGLLAALFATWLVVLGFDLLAQAG
jgi:hypothetical protein